MQPRSERILDAAIQVVGTGGVRALTHRAVDVTASLPMGSTSNLYRTREALLRAMVDRLVATELANWDRLAATAPPATADELADVLAQTLAMLTGPMRILTVARFSLFMEATRDPELTTAIRRAAATLAALGRHWLSRLGSPDPDAHTTLVLAVLDGLVLHQLAYDEPGPDIPSLLRTLLRGLVGGVSEPD